MQNYYDILGVSQNASAKEIKTAFRQLAKLYHPDRNPEGQEKFKKILRAYETLINPARRASYDHKLRYAAGTSATTAKSGRKNWSFEEREMQRRKYYNEHIKKYEKARATAAKAEAEIKPNYNEYKYILYATPLAVALFLLIMNLAGGSSKQNRQIGSHEYTAGLMNKKLKMGDAPYCDHFGRQQYNTAQQKSLTIKNNTGEDVIICLFSEQEFVRSCFIENGYFAEIPQLPEKPFSMRYASGKNWNFTQELKQAGLLGGFTVNQNFYQSLRESVLGPLNEITLTNGLNEGFEQVDEKEFFRKN